MKTAPWLLPCALASSCAPSTRAAPLTSSVTRSVVAPQSSPRPAPEAPAAPPDAPAAPPEMRELLDVHNARRAAHCAPPLAWSPEVAAVAQRYAERLAAGGCGLVHSRGPYGENLFAASPAGSVRGRAVADAWYGEASRYDYARPGFSMQTGHFTQVVWRGTARVGCGVARCSGAEVWVCNYEPAGNVIGQFPANVAPTTCR